MELIQEYTKIHARPNTLRQLLHGYMDKNLLPYQQDMLNLLQDERPIVFSQRPSRVEFLDLHETPHDSAGLIKPWRRVSDYETYITTDAVHGHLDVVGDITRRLAGRSLNSIIIDEYLEPTERFDDDLFRRHYLGEWVGGDQDGDVPRILDDSDEQAPTKGAQK